MERRELESKADIGAHLEDSPVVVWAQDAELKYLWVVNPTMGFDENDVLGKTDIDLLDSPGADALLDLKKKAIGTREEVRETVKTVRPGYQEIHDLVVRPAINDQGQTLGISCVSMRVCGDTQTLVDEANHRIKNSLAVAQVLLRMRRVEASDADARSALTEAEGQLQSIARFHGRLASGGSHGRINVKDYIETVCTDLEATFSDDAFRVETDFADEEVEGPAALKLALIISELVMNAFKHNRGADRVLTVRLSYRSIGSYRELVVEDDGKGLPLQIEPERDSGIGMRIVRMLTKDMGGTLKRDDQSDGARFVFMFPNE